jgi:YhcH/YjgK/YiaL family protein
MFSTSVKFAEKYDYLSAKFKTAYEFLRRNDLAGLPVGVIKLTDDVTVQVQEYTTIPAESGKFETHDKMFDIQYVISGKEAFGIAPRSELTVTEAYNTEKDITFYKDPALSGSVLLGPGDFIVVAPEDAHKPRCISGSPAAVKNLVIKVRV